MSTEIQGYQQEDSLQQARPPAQVLAEAKLAAVELTKVIGMKKNKVMFNGEQYLEFEDWQTVGKFYGCTAKIISTAFVRYGDVSGWEAIAVVLDRNQSIITQAEGLCLNDEENWGMVAKYEWQDELDASGKKIWVDGPNGKKRPKGKKVKVADVAKPLFQLKSMAQTRACARALRQVFAWVVVLAGYAPSVAEEMTGDEHGGEEEQEQKPTVTMPQSTEDKKPDLDVSTIEGTISKISEGKEGLRWLSVEGGLLMVPAEKLVVGLVVGAKIKATAVKRTTKANQAYWSVGTIEVTEFAPEPKAAEEKPAVEAATATEEEATNAVMMEYDETPAKNAAESGKTIGAKRAQSLHIMRSNNQKSTGLTDELFYKLLSRLPRPVEHLRDLDKGMEEQIVQIVTGVTDWRPFLED